MTIRYIDRKTGEYKEEVVAGDKIIRWTYGTTVGKLLLETLMKKKLLTKLFGWYMDIPYSKRKIQKFVKDLDINLSEAQRDKIEGYKNFNDFFARELKVDSRPLCLDEENLVSPADGKILAYENIDINNILQVKGSYYSLKEFIQDEALAMEYTGGICVVVRLAPSDYHRFHFPDSGIPEKEKKIKGHYYSVNPYALRQIIGLYCQNKREITSFNSHNFGKMVLVEVGATCVGSIIQTYKAGKPVDKGAEKGYFKFGGSTTVLFIKKGILKMDEDIIKNTNMGVETKVNMGEVIGKKL